MMNDLNHFFGGDLSGSATGDLSVVDGADKTVQRILRRLMTNPGDYIWHPDYGAGLPRFVGQPIDIGKVQALVRGQVLMEDAVAQSPPPTIEVREIAAGMIVNISYTDAETASRKTLSFNVTV